MVDKLFALIGILVAGTIGAISALSLHEWITPRVVPVHLTPEDERALTPIFEEKMYDVKFQAGYLWGVFWQRHCADPLLRDATAATYPCRRHAEAVRAALPFEPRTLP